MSIKLHSLRVIRNILYRLKNLTEQKYNQGNRLLLREISPGIDPVREATAITDRDTSDDWKYLQPVWVLSTGRTGTNSLTELLRLSPVADAFHEPSPELFRFSFDYYSREISQQEALRALMYLRDEIVFRSFRDGRVYIETNNRVTYIADLLLELYPESKFIHLYRNPYDFIRSGMRRQYYSGHLRDSNRIVPRSSDPYYHEWETFTNLEKVAWNWAAVNHDCLNFVEQLPDRQKLNLSSERFFSADPALIARLFDFIGSSRYHPPAPDIERVMGTRYNAQDEGSFSRPGNWSDEQIVSVDRIIAPVAQRLSYRLLTYEKTEQNMHTE